MEAASALLLAPGKQVSMRTACYPWQ
eukprot:COSAG01_NODE_44668_length_416_cov_5.659306_2_plen_25_part_01